MRPSRPARPRARPLLRCPWWVLLGSACAVADPGDDGHRVAVRIDFEPALREPGELEVAHECGERFVLAAPRSGVELRLRPGPVALVLHAAGRRHEWVLRVGPGMAPVVWELAEPRLP